MVKKVVAIEAPVCLFVDQVVAKELHRHESPGHVIVRAIHLTEPAAADECAKFESLRDDVAEHDAADGTRCAHARR